MEIADLSSAWDLGQCGPVQDRNLLLGFVTSRTPLPGGVRLELDPRAPIDEFALLTSAEQDCCRYFSFAITVDGRGVALEVRAPDDALAVVYGLFGAPP